MPEQARSLGVDLILGRRDALRRAVMLSLAMILGKLDVVHAQRGVLTVDLNQWRDVHLKLGEEVIEISVREIFDALKG